MIARSAKKKLTISPPKTNNKKKAKSKSKSKQKTKKFCPQDFLDALIDLQNTNCSTNRKKRNTTRDISSALTIATPALEKTISSTKIRSKSSFSQYRKKIAGANKQVLPLDFCAIITEEDNVQYTEKTARSSYAEQEKQNNLRNIPSERGNKKVNLDFYARKIQRAWKNYQTYKMVHRIYVKQKIRKQNLRDTTSLSNQIQIKIKKPDLQKTLRIKKQQALKKQERKEQQLSQTQKIIKSRYQQRDLLSYESEQKSPILYMQQDSEQSRLTVEDEEKIRILKFKQAQRFSEAISLIEQSRTKTKEQLLNQLIVKFEANKKILEIDIDRQLQCLQIQKSSKSQQSSSSRKKDSFVEQYEQIDIGKYSQKSSFCYDYDSMADQFGQFKVFEHRLRIIRDEKNKKLSKIDQNLLDSKITPTEAALQRDKAYSRYQNQKKQIEKSKSQFLFAVTQLKKNALKYQQSNLTHSSSFSKLRKSLSVGNTVLKQVLEDIKLVELAQSESQKSTLFQRIDSDVVDIIQINNSSKPLTNTPVGDCAESPERISRASSEVLDKNNTEVMKQYSEEIQAMIEKQLLDEFIKEAYTDEKLFVYFRPCIEEIYEFRKISDFQILGFIDVLRCYLPTESTMVKRINQKINPSTLQILKIIRDSDYEMEEYELIIPEESFKKYRASLQLIYEQNAKDMVVDEQKIRKRVSDQQLATKVCKLESQKKEKMLKYQKFERDLKIVYMKSVFNCINEFLIQMKSANAFMNSRSSIGPGELTLALKEYNDSYSKKEYENIMVQVQARLKSTIGVKCPIYSLKTYQQIESFQNHIMKQIRIENNQTEFKWVNYMDEVLELWEDLCKSVIEAVIQQECNDILQIFN